MTLHEKVENVILAVNSCNLSREEAFNDIEKYYQESIFQLPAIPKNSEDYKEIETFIELANKISAKYKTKI